VTVRMKENEAEAARNEHPDGDLRLFIVMPSALSPPVVLSRSPKPYRHGAGILYALILVSYKETAMNQMPAVSPAVSLLAKFGTPAERVR